MYNPAKMSTRKRKPATAVQQAFPVMGICPKIFERCHLCNGAKTLRRGGPDGVNVRCSACQGEGIALYAVHTYSMTSTETEESGSVDGVVVTYLDHLTCSVCGHQKIEKRRGDSNA